MDDNIFDRLPTLKPFLIQLQENIEDKSLLFEALQSIFKSIHVNFLIHDDKIYLCSLVKRGTFARDKRALSANRLEKNGNEWLVNGKLKVEPSVPDDHGIGQNYSDMIADVAVDVLQEEEVRDLGGSEVQEERTIVEDQVALEQQNIVKDEPAVEGHFIKDDKTEKRIGRDKRRRVDTNVNHPSTSLITVQTSRTTRLAASVSSADAILKNAFERANTEYFRSDTFKNVIESRLVQLVRSTDTINLKLITGGNIFDANAIKTTITNLCRLDSSLNDTRNRLVSLEYIMSFIMAEIYRVLRLTHNATNTHNIMVANGFPKDRSFNSRLIIGNNIRILEQQLNVSCLVVMEFFPKGILDRHDYMNEYLARLRETEVYDFLHNLAVPVELAGFFNEISDYMAKLETVAKRKAT